MSKVLVLDHPLVKHKVAIMRNKDTGTKEFKAVAKEIAMLMCYEATRELAVEDVDVETPITTARCQMLAGKKLAIVPILRAGLGMVDGMLELIPSAKIGHIGLYRDEETLEPVEYFCKMPSDISERDVFVVDPMLATGGSAVDAIKLIKARGAKNIKFLCLIAAPEGVKKLSEMHPDVDIFCAALDDHLNEHGYIVPGLGDAGDRIFGTK
ncbi:MAG: uracil phosphoribosyltransferase [Ruminococcaceae bacterium]|nr:uracil phosphoribosyltransferase [Oscillospiraceae bacterium]